MNNTLTALSGVKVGHSTHLDKLTGCTVILFDKPYSVAYKAYGGAVDAVRSAETVEFAGAYKGVIPAAKDYNKE